MEFQKKHSLPLVFSALGCVLLLLCAGYTVYRLHKKTDDIQKTEHETRIPVTSDTTILPETTADAVTEPPIPYISPEDDRAYFPARQQEAGDFVQITAEDYRFYGASPITDSAGFNEYCLSCVSLLEQTSQIPDTARSGGNTAVTVDYILYQAQHVYSAIFITTTVCDTQIIEKAVLVRIYDTEADTVYAPLDIYDSESGYADQLATLMRAGYEAAFAQNHLPLDPIFLDETCRADPSCFVNIAINDENLYFYKVYTTETMEPVVLCSTVPFYALYDYEIAVREMESNETQTTEAPVPPPVLPNIEITGAVPASDAVDDSYFDDALFIGNSLIVGLSKSAKTGAQYYASIGLNVKQFFEKEIIPMPDGSIVTVNDAISSASFQKVYLMFGINELGWGSLTSFIEYYEKIIERILEVNPTAIIYVQSIFPINEEKWAKSGDYQSYINNVSVLTFNQKIAEMCENTASYYVNAAECLTDENGSLRAEATGDGVHINNTYIPVWLDYLKTHTVSGEIPAGGNICETAIEQVTAEEETQAETGDGETSEI